MKIAINTCFGGFSLSDLAIERYAELKSIDLYKNKYGLAYNKDNEIVYFNSCNLPRHNPILIKVIEELGDKANEMNAKLEIIEVKEEDLYQIKDYDGKESVKFANINF